MIHCRACGMDSRTTDVCEWCKKPLSAQSQPQTLAQPTMSLNAPPPGAMPLNAPPPGSAPYAETPPAPVPQPQVRISLTGEVIEGPPPPAPTAMPGPAGGFVPPTAFTPAFVQQQYVEEVSGGEKFEKFLAIAMPLLALSVLTLHFLPDALLPIVVVDAIALFVALAVCMKSD